MLDLYFLIFVIPFKSIIDVTTTNSLGSINNNLEAVAPWQTSDIYGGVWKRTTFGFFSITNFISETWYINSNIPYGNNWFSDHTITIPQNVRIGNISNVQIIIQGTDNICYTSINSYTPDQLNFRIISPLQGYKYVRVLIAISGSI